MGPEEIKKELDELRKFRQFAENELSELQARLKTQMSHNRTLEIAIKKLQEEKEAIGSKIEDFDAQRTSGGNASGSSSRDFEKNRELRREYFERELEFSNQRLNQVEEELDVNKFQLESLMKKYKLVKQKYIKQSIRQSELQHILLKQQHHHHQQQQTQEQKQQQPESRQECGEEQEELEEEAPKTFKSVIKASSLDPRRSINSVPNQANPSKSVLIKKNSSKDHQKNK